jgi:hypothetical protein
MKQTTLGKTKSSAITKFLSTTILAKGGKKYSLKDIISAKSRKYRYTAQDEAPFLSLIFSFLESQ